jgi:PhoH-like ATPase
MGNLNQIDTPYLNEISSGLTHVVENLKQWKGSGHLILNETVRSELSEVAEKNL